MPDDTKALERARWVADLAIAYSARMSDGDRLQLLGKYYDIARVTGVAEGVERLAAALEKNIASFTPAEHLA